MMNNYIYAIGFIILLIIFNRILKWVKLKNLVRQQRTKISTKKELIEKLKKDKEQIRNEFFNELSSICKEEELDKIYKSELWKGMPAELVIAVYENYPDKIEETNNPQTKYETYFYNEIPNTRSNARRNFYDEIYLENGIVTWWDIKN